MNFDFESYDIFGNSCYEQYKDQEFNIGDWVYFTNEIGRFIGYVTRIKNNSAKVFITIHEPNKGCEKRLDLIGIQVELKYHEIKLMDYRDLTKDQLLENIDLALDFKDEKMFNLLTGILKEKYCQNV